MAEIKNVGKTNIDYLVCCGSRYPLLRPLGLPLVPGTHPRELASAIEALPAGSVIWFHADFSPGGWGEVGPGAVAFLKQVFSRPIKFIAVSFFATAYITYLTAIESVKIPSEKKYGVDYIYLGYVPGYETGMAALAKDLHIIKQDYYANSIEAQPMMKNLRTMDDIALIVSINNDEMITLGAIRQWATPYNKPMCLITIGAVVATVMPYYPRVVKAIVPSLRGCADYEKIVGAPGQAASQVDALSVSILYAVAVILVGNIKFFWERTKSKRR